MAGAARVPRVFGRKVPSRSVADGLLVAVVIPSAASRPSSSRTQPVSHNVPQCSHTAFQIVCLENFVHFE
jgi:hypothetical protein